MTLHLTDDNISKLKVTVAEEKREEKEKPIWENRIYTSINYNNPGNDTWDPKTFDWEHYSHDLCRLYARHFEKWWDSNKFNWKSGSKYLCNKIKDEHFEKWWDPNKFNWEKDSRSLSDYCSKYFDIWWDPNKYNWETGSHSLVSNCLKDFKLWWDPNKFNWEKDSVSLSNYTPNNFDIWWDPNKYKGSYDTLIKNHFKSKFLKLWWKPKKDIFKYSGLLIESTDGKYEYINDDEKRLRFNIWWNPNQFDWENYSGFLCKELNFLFLDWWDPYKFNLEHHTNKLIKHCSNYFEIWWVYKNSLVLTPVSYGYLVSECSENIKKWWNKEQFPVSLFVTLAKYCSKDFDIWWKPKQFRYTAITLMALIKYCSKDFPKWYHPSILGIELKKTPIYESDIKHHLMQDFKKTKEELPDNLEYDYYRVFEIIPLIYSDFSDLWEDDMIIYRLA
tara:strand:- start:916 stop:2250 length:1335 start_codon:yes stop_codon:yes gene_type:complete